MVNPYLYPVNGLRKIVDPYKKTVQYQMHTDLGVRRLSEREALRLIDAARDVGRPIKVSTAA